MKYIFTAIIFSLFSTAAVSATQISCDQNRAKMGVVPAHASTLTELENKLEEKVEKQGGNAYQIISAGGNTRLHGVAIVYK